MNDPTPDPTHALRTAIEATAHDLRTSLHLVVGLAANLRDGLDGPVSAAQRQHAGRIAEISLTAGELVARLRDLARAGDAPHPRARTDVGALAARVTAGFEAEAAHRGLAFTVADGLPAEARCDALDVAQAVGNMVGNAVKFTPRGGRVMVGVRVMGDFVEVEVRDSGPSIPAGQRALAVTRGGRLARDAAVPGEGLGLAIADAVARAHGGELLIGDAPGGGAAVTLRLRADGGGR